MGLQVRRTPPWQKRPPESHIRIASCCSWFVDIPLSKQALADAPLTRERKHGGSVLRQGAGLRLPGPPACPRACAQHPGIRRQRPGG